MIGSVHSYRAQKFNLLITPYSLPLLEYLKKGCSNLVMFTTLSVNAEKTGWNPMKT
jgi:hypothetical protein